MSNVKQEINLGGLAIVLLIVMFYGSPDIADAIVFALTGHKGW